MFMIRKGMIKKRKEKRTRKGIFKKEKRNQER